MLHQSFYISPSCSRFVKHAFGIMHDHIEDSYITLCKSTIYLESKCSTLFNPSDIVCDVTLGVDVKLRNDVQPFLHPISFLIKSISFSVYRHFNLGFLFS